jgi:hypothetical protein
LCQRVRLTRRTEDDRHHSTGTAAAEAAEREEDPDRVPMTPPHPCRIVVHTAPETVTSL